MSAAEAMDALSAASASCAYGSRAGHRLAYRENILPVDARPA
ncbi:hypothetical protein SLNWT_6335 [Streptomyces albus]|uniref:Uncharacterized protein n=1 Tax=Streptomyces albus (strain ATCC 21838 / DSM 41398 / FERM P-419 / JCM 4703 / NBRC 107858) TaxID=1081613 RepID=A0A0B5F767_STRA4|nr:hypothetical protein SLNWT_6335 [Streptomyces albus]AYN36718.1 hypothetical protein DUI70_6224 [Streptomyces albus]